MFSSTVMRVNPQHSTLRDVTTQSPINVSVRLFIVIDNDGLSRTQKWFMWSIKLTPILTVY